MEVRPSWASPTPTKTLLLVKTSTRGCNMGCNVVHYSPEGRQDRILTVKGGCQQISVPALTSTLNGCSSPFTAHKIHSNNCKHNVPIQQLLRHLLLRSSDRTIVNPAVVAQRLSFIYSRHEQTDNGDKSYTFSSDIAGCLGVCLSSGAESRAEESRGKKRRGEGEKERIRRPLAPPLSGGRLSPGKESPLAPVSSLPVPQSPGESSATPAVVPSGRVRLVFCTARHSCPFSTVVSHRVRMCALARAPPQSRARCRSCYKHSPQHSQLRLRCFSRASGSLFNPPSQFIIAYLVL